MPIFVNIGVAMAKSIPVPLTKDRIYNADPPPARPDGMGWEEVADVHDP